MTISSPSIGTFSSMISMMKENMKKLVAYKFMPPPPRSGRFHEDIAPEQRSSIRVEVEIPDGMSTERASYIVLAPLLGPELESLLVHGRHFSLFHTSRILRWVVRTLDLHSDFHFIYNKENPKTVELSCRKASDEPLLLAMETVLRAWIEVRFKGKVPLDACSSLKICVDIPSGISTECAFYIVLAPLLGPVIEDLLVRGRRFSLFHTPRLFHQVVRILDLNSDFRFSFDKENLKTIELSCRKVSDEPLLHAMVATLEAWKQVRFSDGQTTQA